MNINNEPMVRLMYKLHRMANHSDRMSKRVSSLRVSSFLSGKSIAYTEAAEEVRKFAQIDFVQLVNAITNSSRQIKTSRSDVDMPCCIEVDLPAYAHEGDAGMDIRASEGVIIHKGEYKVVHTGLHIECPEGHVAYVMPRSGLAVKNGITVLNAPGVVDSGYRGEIVVPLINLGREVFEVEPGDRIAQLIISPYTKVQPVSVESLGDSARGSDGLGSTGVK